MCSCPSSLSAHLWRLRYFPNVGKIVRVFGAVCSGDQDVLLSVELKRPSLATALLSQRWENRACLWSRAQRGLVRCRPPG